MKVTQFALLWCVASLFTSSASAAQSTCQQWKVGVKGMVCDFCAHSIEELFKKRTAVEAFSIDFDKAELTVGFAKAQTIDEAAIRGLIKDSGYEASTVAMACEAE